MPDCQILTEAVQDSPGDPNSTYTAVSRCVTHGMPLGSILTQLPDSPLRCPIGLIEEATEVALAKIAAATKGAA